MSDFTSRCISAIGLALAVASPTYAQYGVANLTFADGGVTRQHRGAPAATAIGVSIMDGDSIETTNDRADTDDCAGHDVNRGTPPQSTQELALPEP